MKEPLLKLSVIALIVALMVSFLPMQVQTAYAVSPNIVISQVYGGGGNSGATYKNDFIELYNLGATAVDVTGWSVQYGSATGSTWTGKTALSGTIDPGKYYLVQEAVGAGGTTSLPTPDATGTISMAGGAGKVALVNNSTTLTGACPTGMVDLVGYGTTPTTANCSETAPTVTLSNTTAALRAGSGCTDTDNNAADFASGAPTPRHSATAAHSCSGPTNPSGVGQATPGTLFAGDATVLSVAVTPGTNPASTGLSVTCDLTAIGGPASQAFAEDGSNTNTFTYDATVASSTTVGAKSLACTIGDAQNRTGSATIALTVTAILPIGTVQGVVNEGDNGALSRSPYAPPSGTGSGQTVVIQGVIYEKTLQAIASSTNTYKGFFIQNTAATADKESKTSDGMFVFMSFNSTISAPGGSTYTPTVGDEVIISGTISEYYLGVFQMS